MFKLVFILISFFTGYFIADLELIYIPFDSMPYLEDLYKHMDN